MTWRCLDGSTVLGSTATVGDEREGSGDPSEFYDAVASRYGERYDKDKLLSADRYSANYFRLQILSRALAASNAKSVYEVGVGEGTPLVVLAGTGLQVAGCDISREMVRCAKERFTQAKLDPERIQYGDIEDPASFAVQAKQGPYDAVIAAGVLPHVKDDLGALRNMRTLVRTGGKALIEFRNKLFSLFTFNRFSHDFIVDELLAEVAPEVKAAVSAELKKRCAMDLPAAGGKGGNLRYEDIRARFHNPFELPPLFEAAGFRFVRLHWYHFHAAPPLAEAAVGTDTFRRESMRLEGRTDDWRGYFLCSAGVVEADAVEAEPPVAQRGPSDD